MNKQELINEHKRLIRILEHGSQLEQHEEAERQKKELEGYEKDSRHKLINDKEFDF